MAKDDYKKQDEKKHERSCDGCKKVDARVTALFAYMKSTRTRCPCGLLVTREIRLTHPVMGTTSCLKCETCLPGDVYQDGLSKMEDLMLDGALEAIATNEALRGS